MKGIIMIARDDAGGEDADADGRTAEEGADRRELSEGLGDDGLDVFAEDGCEDEQPQMPLRCSGCLPEFDGDTQGTAQPGRRQFGERGDAETDGQGDEECDRRGDHGAARMRAPEAFGRRIPFGAGEETQAEGGDRRPGRSRSAKRRCRPGQQGEAAKRGSG